MEATIMGYIGVYQVLQGFAGDSWGLGCATVARDLLLYTIRCLIPIKHLRRFSYLPQWDCTLHFNRHLVDPEPKPRNSAKAGCIQGCCDFLGL